VSFVFTFQNYGLCAKVMLNFVNELYLLNDSIVIGVGI